MFNKGRFRKVLTITMLLVLTLSTIVLAANEINVKKLTATHGRIKFKVDGKDVTSQIESKYSSPAFTVKEYNSRSYVPVRAIAELMGMEVKWDGETHTAEIVDVKSKEYEEEIEKKDKEIAELKKEIEKLKKNVVEETDLKAMEKKLNSEYGTYEDVDFDIRLKESTNRIDVTMTMDLRNSRQEGAWNRINYNNRKAMIEDIVDMISSEFKNVDIYGSIYDEYYRKDVHTFNKKQDKSLSMSYGGRSGSNYDYDDDIDGVVYDEFGYYDIDAYLEDLRSSSSNVYLEVDIHYGDKSEWRGLGDSKRLDILDKISDEVFYYYDCDRVIIDVYVDGSHDEEYIMDHDDRRGSFK